MRKMLPVIIMVLALVGIWDAGYLTYEHYSGAIPLCSGWSDCGKVLKSQYSLMFGVPLALIGLVHYLLEFGVVFYAVEKRSRTAIFLLLTLTTIGLVASIYFVYLQLAVIGAICLYCMGSAGVSLGMFVLTQAAFSMERKRMMANCAGGIYQYLVKPILFGIDPERVHVTMVGLGEILGQVSGFKWVTSYLFSIRDDVLRQRIAGIEFMGPVGLAAGFDYEGRLTQTLAPLGFGFQSIGTITNEACEGNSQPRLGRLPRSLSLMVNKGFRNLGSGATALKLSGMKFDIPVGISVGRTNTEKLKTQKQSVEDIVSAFKNFEAARVGHAYYELNISCPNLKGKIEFYSARNLEELLKAVDKLHLSRPVFVKMPIEKGNPEVLGMLRVISKHCPKGVIFGNLQKNRKDPALDAGEVAKFPVGNFSGKPTFNRSNELISLCYKHYKKRFVIIGCGGIFSGGDAYEKIKRGASLLQLITGMIYKGPQLVSQINLELLDLLKRDGYGNVGEVVGKGV